ncbi:MAG TPA: Ig-like domain-containing protein, partial [Candidatus Paceibacterota bacterium]|nr:Ig-like domain-containing protein [Candidatus Paceibacterota bacterium]
MRFLSEKFKKNKSFTLIEMVVVVGILAILTVVSISLMNPAENFRQSRDSQRISDLNNVNVAITKIKYSDKRLTQSFLGSTNVIYTSLPDQLTSCGNYNLPTPPTGWTYHCVDQSVLRKTDGTGWIPVNFDSIGADSGIISLPIDPSNNADDLTFYTYAIDSSGKYELSAYLESIKERARVAAKDGGSDDDYYEIGTSFALLNPQEASGTLVSALNSLVSASPLQASADNTELITITITAKDSLGNPISGLVATTSVTGSGNTITQPLFVTNSNGVATGTLKSSVGETKTISAIVDDVNIVQTVDVIFSPVYTTGSWVTDSSGGPTQGNGNSIAEVDGMIYVIAGNSQTFRKYNPSTKVWSNLADTPTGVGVGASLVKFNSNTIYFSSGNSVNFYKYTISTNVWSQMASMPAGMTSGGSLTYPGTGDLIYALQGANQKSFWQYSIANNCWSVYNNAQSWGNSIVEVDGILYVMNGGSQAFYKFEPTKNKWTQLLDVPAGVTVGASMVKITSNLIYASSGNSANFYKYTISSNTWTKMTNMPTSMTSGGSLAYPGTGDLIYALQGANQKS